MPNTTMNSLRNSITEMGARIREAASALAVAAADTESKAAPAMEAPVNLSRERRFMSIITP